MDFTQLTQYFVLVVLIACLIVGYIIKTSFNMIPNKDIPTILAVLGAVLNTVVTGLSVESVAYGALMRLSSTGMHQAFTKFIDNDDKDKSKV